METQASICRELGVDPPLAAYYQRTGLMARFTVETADVWRNRLRLILAGKKKGLTVQEMRQALGAGVEHTREVAVGLTTFDEQLAKRFGVSPQVAEQLIAQSKGQPKVIIEAPGVGLPETATAEEIRDQCYALWADAPKAASRPVIHGCPSLDDAAADAKWEAREAALRRGGPVTADRGGAVDMLRVIRDRARVGGGSPEDLVRDDPPLAEEWRKVVIRSADFPFASDELAARSIALAATGLTDGEILRRLSRSFRDLVDRAGKERQRGSAYQKHVSAEAERVVEAEQAARDARYRETHGSYDLLQKRAAELMKVDKSLTPLQAQGRILNEDSELAAAYRREFCSGSR